MNLPRTSMTAWVAFGALLSCGNETNSKSVPTAPATKPAPARPEYGKWYKARKRKVTSAETQARISHLEGLGYASGTEEAVARSSVIPLCTEDKVQAGYNFFVSGHGPIGTLMDMHGEEVHRWECSVNKAWPAGDALRDRDFWRRARPLPNGDLLAIFENVGLIKLNKDSEVLWTHQGLAHHDLDLDDQGRIYLLERKAGLVPWVHPERPVLDDYFVVLDSDGKRVQTVSLLACIKNSPLHEELSALLDHNIQADMERERLYREENADKIAADPKAYAKLDLVGDIFHTNTIQYLDGSQAADLPAFAKGNLMICVRNLGTIMVIDLEKEQVVWHRGGAWSGLHEPTMLGTGTILLFDNNGPKERGLGPASEVLEINPLDGEVVWRFMANEPKDFYSHIAGTCQRLANGNTLIVESTRGRAFEVDPAGDMVWEFLSPYRAGKDNQLIAFLPDLQRIPHDQVDGWCEGLERR